MYKIYSRKNLNRSYFYSGYIMGEEGKYPPKIVRLSPKWGGKIRFNTSAMVGIHEVMPCGSPGMPMVKRPVRNGSCPRMKDARPAVQLCCPYESVKSAPSLAMRSMFGVR